MVRSDAELAHAALNALASNRGAVILEIAGRGSPEEILGGAQRARAFLQRLAAA